MKKINGLECILLVDDDDASNFIHKMEINKLSLDVKVEVVHNGKEALEYLTATGKYAGKEGVCMPGIIFLDINMPIMNGWEFLEEYRKLTEEQKAKIVVAMLTTSTNAVDENFALQNSEIAQFIHKPIRQSVIEKLIHDYFEK
jgi:CheY-like chemotaxis protein